jgi:hypothetical protein
MECQERKGSRPAEVLIPPQLEWLLPSFDRLLYPFCIFWADHKLHDVFVPRYHLHALEHNHFLSFVHYQQVYVIPRSDSNILLNNYDDSAHPWWN